MPFKADDGGRVEEKKLRGKSRAAPAAAAPDLSRRDSQLHEWLGDVLYAGELMLYRHLGFGRSAGHRDTCYCVTSTWKTASVYTKARRNCGTDVSREPREPTEDEEPRETDSDWVHDLILQILVWSRFNFACLSTAPGNCRKSVRRHFRPLICLWKYLGPTHYIQGGKKSKPLPNDQKIVLNRIKACQWDYICS